MMREQIISINHSASSKYERALMDVEAGEVVVLVGVSGSGKSTLLRCLNFLEKSQEGEIR